MTAREQYRRGRIPRRHRRVMAVLLSGAGDMNMFTGGRAAMAWIAFARVTGRLEQLGWARRQSRMDDGMEYEIYRYVLTPEGRAALLEILGLAEYDVSERWADAPLERAGGESG